MNLRQIFLGILLGLQVLDIGTTEYVFKKDIADEGNPLWRKEKVRRFVAYPIKFISPLIIEGLTYLSDTPVVQKFGFWSMVGFTGFMSIVVGNNLYQIFKKDK